MRYASIFIFTLTISFFCIADGKDKSNTLSIYDIKSEIDKKLDEQNFKNEEFNSQISGIKNDVNRIQSNQINYRIEKDLIKETYSNNFDKLNFFITIILGVFGAIGFLGIRDISSIKEKYQSELDKIKELKNAIDIKSVEFDAEKKKIDDELKTIIKENQEQSQRIKFIELKEKMLSLYTEKKMAMALEFANMALEINPIDKNCLHIKGSILVQLNQLDDAVLTFEKAVKENPSDNGSKLNYLEVLYFLNRISEANNLIENNKLNFDDETNLLPEFLKIIEIYHNGDKQKLDEIAKGYVTFENLEQKQRRMKWSFEDAQLFSFYQTDSPAKTALQNLVWYWNGKITGKQLLTNLNLPIPKKGA